MVRTVLTIAVVVSLSGLGAASVGLAQKRSRTHGNLREPMHRVAKNIDQKAINKQPQPNQSSQLSGGKPAGHPIDQALEMARDGLQRIQANVQDYTTTLVKRETYNGKLGEPEFIFLKVRNRKVANGRVVTPFSVYMKYLQPSSKRGQEAIWVEGQNNNKIVGHGTGLQGFITVYLDPDGYVATRGTNYRIYDSGIENLIKKLIERGMRARQDPKCQAQYYKNATINGRDCDLIEVRHPVRKPGYEFHIGRIFIDKQLQLPVRYAAYGWPTAANGKPPLIEEFTYVNLRTNVGLTAADFNHKNPEYDYP